MNSRDFDNARDVLDMAEARISELEEEIQRKDAEIKKQERTIEELESPNEPL